MKSKRLLIIYLTFLFIGCKPRACYERTFLELQENTEFDYQDYVAKMRKYLLSNGYLKGHTNHDYLTFFENQTYCSLSSESMYEHVDVTFANAPSIGAALISCLDKSNFSVENYSDQPSQEIIHILSSNIPDKTIDETMKYFVYYTLAILLDSC